jgi:hypothetical protein
VAHKQRTDFSDLVGRWTPDPAFDEILAAQRQIDPDTWEVTVAGGSAPLENSRADRRHALGNG